MSAVLKYDPVSSQPEHLGTYHGLSVAQLVDLALPGAEPGQLARTRQVLQRRFAQPQWVELRAMVRGSGPGELRLAARALGTAGSSTVTPVPAHACSERTYAALDMHAAALAYMHRWGVEEVQSDPRARQAYVLAVRSARLLSASAE